MTDAPPTFTAHDVPDLINALPTLFGFTPVESLVAIATHGPRRRFGFRLRMDLPSAASSAPDVASLVVRHLLNQRAEGAILIVVTQRQDVALATLDAIHHEIDSTDGIDLIVRVRADGSRYWTDVPGDAPGGSPYETSPHHLAIVHAVAAGQQILPDRETLVARFGPVTGSDVGGSSEEQPRSCRRSCVRSRVSTRPAGTGRTSVVGPILDRAVSAEPVSDADLLRLAAWTSCIKVRDEVWARITRDTSQVMLDVLVRVAQSVVPPFEPAVAEPGSVRGLAER
ncbi:DUF4192 domain-containing protein [Aeromicrobium sp. UC242_57]|uniref:DUF4192 domain-containing protein n=1 Tax=Aeromicrobium sp. UC242_57 TaxID=3374624 RepID=UPI00378A5127